MEEGKLPMPLGTSGVSLHRAPPTCGHPGTQLGSRRDAELAVDAGEVRLHRRGADVQGASNLLVGRSGRSVLGHLVLAWGEARPGRTVQAQPGQFLAGTARPL